MDPEYNPDDASVVDTNSWAIVQLMEGEQAEALKLFHRALDGSREQLGEAAPALRESLGQPPQSLDAEILPISLDGVTVSRGNPVPDNYFRMYRCVYSIEGDDCESNILAPEITVVLVYNLAVVYHELGFVTSDNALIDKAMRLYELARMVLTRARQAKRQILAMNLIELELAVLNNLGHTYAYFRHYEQMTLLREALHSLVQELDPRQMEHGTYIFFVRNILETIPHDHLPAAAA